MAWIEQTKKGSRKSGGPQYYLQGLTGPNAAALRSFRRRPVLLWTPYGIQETGLTAVSHKVGSVGHDRVQSGGRVPSVARQIARWYSLTLKEIERIEFDDSFDDDHFMIRPSRVKFFGRKRAKTLEQDWQPLTLVDGHRSSLLKRQLADRELVPKACLQWVRAQIEDLVSDHEKRAANVGEADLLRAAAALCKMGISLGLSRNKGLDCPDATFTFCGYPRYECALEIEKRSSTFRAPHHKKSGHHDQRVVVLCMRHDAPSVLHRHVDVFELRELSRLLGEVA